MEKKYRNWHKKFFTGLWMELQLTMFSEAETAAQTKFIIDVLKLKKKDKILDVPCGSGRITNVLSRKGYQVTGVDNNDYLLGLAGKKNKKYKVQPTFVKNEMYNINFENEFDAILCFWGSFGYFEDVLNEKFLERVYKALKPHGRFLINTHILDTLLPKFQKRGWIKVGNIYMLEEREFDPINSRINVDWTLIKNEKIEKKVSSIRLYSYREFVDLLKSIGFKSFKAFDSIKKREFDFSNAGLLYLIAQK